MRQPEWGRERKKSGEHCATDRGGEQGATAKKKNSWKKRQVEKTYLSLRERYAEHAVNPEKSYTAIKSLRPGIAEPAS